MRRGKTVPFERIVSEYGPMVTSICRRMIQNEEDARDAAQEVWMAVFQGLPGFRGDAKLSTWIYSVTCRSAMRFAAKERMYTTRFLRQFLHGDPLEIPVEVDMDKDLWIRHMCDRCLTGIARCLDCETRIAYFFRDMVELAYDEIAEILDKDPAAVRQMVSRARRKLKNFLKDECSLHNPEGTCQCRMKHLVEEIDLPDEYRKMRTLVARANVYKESRKVLPQKNYWENILN